MSCKIGVFGGRPFERISIFAKNFVLLKRGSIRFRSIRLRYEGELKPKKVIFKILKMFNNFFKNLLEYFLRCQCILESNEAICTSHVFF
jgi:hypothetical protein